MNAHLQSFQLPSEEWPDPNRRARIGFNTFLGRDAENERLYQEQTGQEYENFLTDFRR